MCQTSHAPRILSRSGRRWCPKAAESVATCPGERADQFQTSVTPVAPARRWPRKFAPAALPAQYLHLRRAAAAARRQPPGMTTSSCRHLRLLHRLAPPRNLPSAEARLMSHPALRPAPPSLDRQARASAPGPGPHVCSWTRLLPHHPCPHPPFCAQRLPPGFQPFPLLVHPPDYRLRMSREQTQPPQQTQGHPQNWFGPGRKIPRSLNLVLITKALNM